MKRTAPAASRRPSTGATTEREIINTLRAITRLQTQARKLRRQLKKVTVDLRAERRTLRGLQAHLEDRRPDVAPMRVFGGAVGMVPAKVERVVDEAVEAFEIGDPDPTDNDGGAQ